MFDGLVQILYPLQFGLEGGHDDLEHIQENLLPVTEENERGILVLFFTKDLNVQELEENYFIIL